MASEAPEAGASTPAPVRWGRRARRTLAAILLFGAIFTGAAWAYLRPERLTPLLTHVLDDALPGSVKIARIEWSLPLLVDVRGFTLSEPGGAPVLTIERASASFFAAALLRNRLAFEDIRAQGVVVHLLQATSTAAFGLLTALSSPDPSPGQGIGVDLEITQVDQVTFRLQQPGLSLWVSGATVAEGRLLAAEGAFLFTGDVTARRTELFAGGRQFGPSPVTAQALEVRFGPDEGHGRVAATALTVQTVDGRPVTLRGQLTQLGDTAQVEGRAEARIELEDRGIVRPVLGVLGELFDPRGPADVSVQLKGPLASPTISVGVEAKGLSLLGQAVERLSLQATIGDEIVDFASLVVEAGGRLSARGPLGLTRVPDAPLEINLDRAPLRQWLAQWTSTVPLPERTTGTIALEGLRLTPLASTATFDLMLQGLPELPVPFGDEAHVVGRGYLSPGSFRADQLNLKSPKLTASISGFLGEGLDLSLAATHRDLPALGRAAGLPLAGTSVKLVLRLKGSLKRLSGAGQLSARDLRILGSPPLQITTPITIEGPKVAFSSLVATSTFGWARARGHVDFADKLALDATVHTGTIAIGPLSQGYATGTFELDGTVRGPVDALAGRGALRLSGLAIRGAPLGDGGAEVALEAGELRVSALSVAQPGGGTIEGQFRLAPGRLEAHFEGRDLPASAPSLWLGLGESSLEGATSLAVDLNGSLSEPRAAVALAAPDLSIDGEPLGALGLAAQATREIIDASASLVGEAGTLEVAGKTTLADHSIQGAVSAHGLKLERMPLIQRLSPVPSGRLDLDVEVQGTLESPALTGRLAAAALTLSDRPVLAGDLVLELAPVPGTRLHELALVLPPKVRARGRVELSRHPSLEVVVEVVDLALEDVWPEGVEEGLGGHATGTATLRYENKALTGALELQRLTLSAAGTELSLNAPGHLSWDGRSARFERLELEGSMGQLALEGSVGEEADIRGEGRLDVALLRPFLPFFAQAQGMVRISARARGSLMSPALSGELTVEGPLRLRPRGGFREILVDGGRVTLSPSELRAEHVLGRMAGGTFRLGGRVELAGMRPIGWGLRFEAQAIPVRAGDLSIETNADLSIVGQGAIPRLEGELEIIRGRYAKAFELKDFSFVAKKNEGAEPLVRQAPWLRDLELNLSARTSGTMDLKVDASSIGVEMGLLADLQVHGTFAEPLIEGRVTAERGTLRFPKAKLSVDRGTVDFVPTSEGTSEGRVDLAASGEVVTPSLVDSSGRREAITVEVSLAGPLDQLDLGLTSPERPELDRLRLLSLLITGYLSPTDLLTTSGQSASTVESAIAFAGAQLTGPFAGFLEDQLEKQLNLKVQLGAEVSTESFRVTASKDIARRLTIEGAYEQTFESTAQITTTARARLLLFDRAFMEAQSELVTGGTRPDPGRSPISSTVELKYRIFGR